MAAPIRNAEGRLMRHIASTTAKCRVDPHTVNHSVLPKIVYSILKGYVEVCRANQKHHKATPMLASKFMNIFMQEFGS